MLTHEQITLPDGIEVDAGIASLLNTLWDLGLRTNYSCQGTPAEPGDKVRDESRAYVLFPEIADAWAFFAQTLEAISVPDRTARIDISVRLLSRPRPGQEPLAYGPAVTLELSLDPFADGRSLRGCVRFDPALMAQVEAAFTEDPA